jgi:DNA-binding transcriptional LysR family regulator
MNRPASLDPDLLRSFVHIADSGSFTRAAELVGRTQSAVSMQMQRLEGFLGQALLLRGRGESVQLTPHGLYLLGRAREMLALNDAIWNGFHAPSVQGRVRLGIPDDYALRYLPQILMRFAQAHPAVEVEVLCLPSAELTQRLAEDALDLAICSQGDEPARAPAIALARGPLVWVTSERFAPHRQKPLPVALAHRNCSWSGAAVRALTQAGRRYRVAYSSSTLLGTHAPVIAGLAVTVSSTAWLPEGLRRVRPDEGLPALPEYGILLVLGPEARQPVTDALAGTITEMFRAEAPRSVAGER